MWILMRRLLGDLRKAALLTSLALVLFFAYDAIVTTLTLRGFFPAGEWTAGGHLVVMSAAIGLWVGIALLLRKRPTPSGWTYCANFVGTTVVFLPLVVVVQSAYVTSLAARTIEWRHHDLPSAGEGRTQSPPDIYWIIPDGYSRADVLANIYAYDDQPFLDALRDRGFHIPPQAVSHYSKTANSVASTLNLDYIQDLLRGDLEQSFDWVFIRNLLDENRVARFLKTLGYRSLTVLSQYDNLDWPADLRTSESWFLNFYEVRLLERTPIPALSRVMGFPILYEHHRARTRHALQWASQTAKLPGPKFVFVQVVTPHPPFIFGPDGEPVDPPQPYSWKGGLDFQNQPGSSLEDYREGYLNQVRYLHEPLIEVVDAIQAASAQPPVIIILSDHGASSGEWLTDLSHPEAVERFGVLCALSLPGVDADEIPDDLASVNVFRLIFNQYFDTGLDMLESKQFHLVGEQPYHYMPVELPQVSKLGTDGKEEQNGADVNQPR